VNTSSLASLLEDKGKTKGKKGKVEPPKKSEQPKKRGRPKQEEEEAVEEGEAVEEKSYSPVPPTYRATLTAKVMTTKTLNAVAKPSKDTAFAKEQQPLIGTNEELFAANSWLARKTSAPPSPLSLEKERRASRNEDDVDSEEHEEAEDKKISRPKDIKISRPKSNNPKKPAGKQLVGQLNNLAVNLKDRGLAETAAHSVKTPEFFSETNASLKPTHATPPKAKTATTTTKKKAPASKSVTSKVPVSASEVEEDIKPAASKNAKTTGRAKTTEEPKTTGKSKTTGKTKMNKDSPAAKAKKPKGT